ncbi:MAG: hypothetical protein ACJAXX_001597 [Roseivirga sp.]|jgi:hypothetical protein
MDKDQIFKQLSASYAQFTGSISALNADEFEYAPTGKWSAGQQLEHLIKSTSPILKGLGYPKFLISFKFGKATSASRTFDQLVEGYNDKLSSGGTASSRFVPGEVSFDHQKKLQNQLTAIIEGIIEKLDKWTEAQLDEYIFPHPLLGKLTIREMMYFTIHHADHHRNRIKIYLKGV